MLRDPTEATMVATGGNERHQHVAAKFQKLVHVQMSIAVVYYVLLVVPVVLES